MKNNAAASNYFALARPLMPPRNSFCELKRRAANNALRMGSPVVTLCCVAALSGCANIPSGGTSPPPPACIAWGCG